MKSLIIVENVRSAYNVGNIIRTADALGYDVLLSGFSPSPFDDLKVKKSSLGAEEHVTLEQYWNPAQALDIVQERGYTLIAAECNDTSVPLEVFVDKNLGNELYAIVVGNENVGVLAETLERVDHVVHIPMLGSKESLNVGQAAAIMMWALK